MEGSMNIVARYTQANLNAPAEIDPRYDRPFYKAGRKIDGSVIQHAPGSEVMVVDFDKDPTLRKFYETVMSDYQRPTTKIVYKNLSDYFQFRIIEKIAYSREVSDAIVDGTLQAVVSKLKQQSNAVDRRINVIDVESKVNSGSKANKKIYVGEYLEMGAGVCRQMGTILGACMERAILEGKAPDWKGVEIRSNMDIPGGHLWVACLNSDGKTIRINDPAQGFYGEAEKGKWNYNLGYEKHVFGVPDS